VTVVEPNRYERTAARTDPSVPRQRAVAEKWTRGGLSQYLTYPQLGVAVLTVTGEVDIATAPRLAEMLQSRLCTQLRRLVLDLSDVRFLGVAGVSAIMTAELRARCAGVEMVVVAGGNRPVTRALTATAGHHPLRWHTGPVASAVVACSGA